MAIVNYPDRIYKTTVPAINRAMTGRTLITTTGAKDITSAGLDVVITPRSNWQIDSMSFVFSNATSRNYSASIKNGRRVVTDYNDYLWIRVKGISSQRIILDDGFYNGTELATHLNTKLDANVTFNAQNITFTVVYDDTTGNFTITPSSGEIRYLDVNQAQTLPNRQSIAGHLFGLTETTDFASTVVSDTPILGLDIINPIINATGVTDLSRYNDDIHALSIDQALIIESDTAALTVTYTIVHEEI